METFMTYEDFLKSMQSEGPEYTHIKIYERIVDINEVKRQFNNYSHIREGVIKDIEVITGGMDVKFITDVSKRVEELDKIAVNTINSIRETVSKPKIQFLFEINEMTLPMETNTFIWHNNKPYRIYESHYNSNNFMKYVLVESPTTIEAIRTISSKINLDEIADMNEAIIQYMMFVNSREDRLWNRIRNLFKRKED